MTSQNSVVYSLRDVIKSVKDGQGQKQILNIRELDINRGEFCGIKGESGAGKSTLLNIIGGMDKIDSGEIIFNNSEYICRKTSAQLALFRRKIGFIFQSFQLIEHLNVLENVTVPLMLQGINERESKRKAIKALEDAHLIEYEECENRRRLTKDSLLKLKQSITTLSGGEQQRVAIARAIVNDPIVILADEPTGNLDSKNEESILKLLQDIHNDLQVVVILVSHSDRVIDRCSRVITIDDGKILADKRYY